MSERSVYPVELLSSRMIRVTDVVRSQPVWIADIVLCFALCFLFCTVTSIFVQLVYGTELATEKVAAILATNCKVPGDLSFTGTASDN